MHKMQAIEQQASKNNQARLLTLPG